MITLRITNTMTAPSTRRGALLATALATLHWAAPVHAQSATITDLQVGNVTSSTLTAVWRVSGTADTTPSLELFSDAELTQPPAGDPVVQVCPLATGNPDVPGSSPADYQRRATLKNALAAEGVALVRVTGLAPSTEYHLRPDALDSAGTSVLSGEPPSLAATTAEASAFVPEARQVVFDLSDAPDGSAANDGAVAKLTVADAAYPLYAVVGDGVGAGRAFFDLANLLDSGGATNAIFSGQKTLTLSLVRDVANPTQTTVTFDGPFVVANAVTVPFMPGPALAGFAFDPIPTRERNVAFPVTIRAVDANGNPASSFSGTVVLTSDTATLSQGGGETAPFSAGVLDGHDVAVAELGMHRLKATTPDGAATGESNSFEVVELLRTLEVIADPEVGGTVTGGGSYANNTQATISASAAQGYRFARWVGGGVDTPEDAMTSILMDRDRTATAIFERIVTADYDAWARENFLRDAADPAIAGPTQDPDNDGVINLLALGFGRDPTVPDGATGLPTLHWDGSALTLSFHRIRNATNVTYTVLFTPDLAQPFSELAIPPEDVTATPIDQDYERVEIALSRSQNFGFYRVEVDLQDG